MTQRTATPDIDFCAVMKLWREHGGGQHGPHVETVTMPLQRFYGFIAAFIATRPLIERAARASADAEIAELRASLAKAEEALEPFSSFGISDDGTLSPAALIRDRICDWFGPSDFAAATAALSDLRKARGEAK